MKQRLVNKYSRAVRTRRPDLMKQNLSKLRKVAIDLSPTERRKLFKTLASKRTKFHCAPDVKLLPTWKEREAMKAAKTNWADQDKVFCLNCGVEELDQDACRHGTKAFLPIIPCGHRVLCFKCARQVLECPCCKTAIDHAMKAYLRPQTPVVNELNVIMGSIRRGRTVNLSLIRRASLARVRDARHIGDDEGQFGKRTIGDRTSHILKDLGTAVNMSSTEIEKLDLNLEDSICKASQTKTSKEGQEELLHFFSQLVPSTEGNNKNLNSNDDMFCLTRKDNTSWSRSLSQVIWNYDEQDINDSTTKLPYFLNDGDAVMQRFRALFNPRILAKENEQLLLEKVIRKEEIQQKKDDHIIKREVQNMIYEDHVSHIARYWNKSVTEREKILDGVTDAGMDLDKIDELFVSIKSSFKKKYKKGWFEEVEHLLFMKRAARSAKYCLAQSELQRIMSMLLCYQKSCKDKNVSILGTLEREMLECDRLNCISASQVSCLHVECLTDLIITCGNVGHESMEKFELNFAKLNIAVAKRMAQSLKKLSHLKILSVQNCQSNDNACLQFIESMTKCPNLTELNLSCNKLSESGKSSKASKRFLECLTLIIAGGLKTLILSRNELGINTGFAIANGINNSNSIIQKIDLSWNSLQKDGILAILNAVSCRGSTNTQTLEILDIRFNEYRMNEIQSTIDKVMKVVPKIQIIVKPLDLKYESMHPADSISIKRRQNGSKNEKNQKRIATKKKK
jgi:hypothetical protein